MLSTVLSSSTTPVLVYNATLHQPVDSITLINGVLDIAGDANASTVKIDQKTSTATLTTSTNTTITQSFVATAVHQIAFAGGTVTSHIVNSTNLPISVMGNAIVQNTGGTVEVRNSTLLLVPSTPPNPNTPLQWGTVSGPGTYAQAEHDLSLTLAQGGFIDQYGFVVNRQADATGYEVLVNGKLQYQGEDQGDATWRTGLALIDASLTGNPTNAKIFLNALLNNGWVSGAPVRHPTDPQPLSHDGFDTLLAGAYYAYTKFSPSTGLPQEAKALVTKYLNFLMANQWHLYTVAQTSLQGVDMYVLAPTEIADITNVAQIMGIDRSIPLVSVEFTAEVADILRGDIRANIQTWLAKIAIPVDLKLGTIVPGAPEYKFTITLPAAVQSDLAEYIADGLFQSSTNGFEVVSNITNAIDKAINQVADRLPGAMDVGGWKSLIEGVIQKGLPWLNYDELTTGASFIAGFLQQQKASGSNYYFVHDFFWQTMVICETRPEMADLLMPSANNLYANIAINHMAPFAWFTNHTTEVTADLSTLASHTWDDVDFVWQNPLSSQQDGLGKPYGGPSHAGKLCPRLDYLIMTDLVKHGVPHAFTAWAISGVLTQLSSTIDTALDKAFGAAITKLGTWVKGESGVAASWVKTEIASLTNALPGTLQSITNNSNSYVASWKSWLAGETTRLNNLIINSNANIVAWQQWLSSSTAPLSQDIQNVESDITNHTNSYTSYLTTDAQRLNTWISTTATSDLNRINTWLKTQQDIVYQWYVGEWNKLNAGVSNAEDWVNSEVDNYDGGQWAHDLGFSLTGNPWDTLTSTYNNILNDLQKEGQTTYDSDFASYVASAQSAYNTDIANAKSDLTNFVNNANAQITGFNQQIKNLTAEANNAIAGCNTTIANAAAAIPAETTEANNAIATAQANLPAALAAAKASLTSEVSKLTAAVPTLTTNATTILAGLNLQLANEFVSVIASNPYGNLGALPDGLVTTLTVDTTNKLNTVFASAL